MFKVLYFIPTLLCLFFGLLLVAGDLDGLLAFVLAKVVGMILLYVGYWLLMGYDAYEYGDKE